MKNKILISIIFTFAFLSSNGQTGNQSLDNEILDWKKELVLNGELGEPCNYENHQEWIKENPNKVFGISNDLKINKVDFNNDGVLDAFVNMNVEACNGGNAFSTGYTVLIFSNKGKYYKDTNLKERIEKKLQNKLKEQGITNVYKLSTSLDSTSKKISGESYIYIEEDANCCASYSATFKYNMSTKKLDSEIIKN